MSSEKQRKDRGSDPDEVEIYLRGAVIQALGCSRWDEFYWYTPEEVEKLKGSEIGKQWSNRNRRNGSNK
jgi:hypothetical protein